MSENEIFNKIIEKCLAPKRARANISQVKALINKYTFNN